MSWFIAGPLMYAAVALFLYKTITLVLKYATMPRHIRWDIYPVPHQGVAGSKYQQVDFAAQAPHSSLLHELIEMSQEMLFIKKAFINNPKVWRGSFPLHLGIYLGLGWLLLLAIGAIAQLFGIPVTTSSSGVFLAMVYYLTQLTGGLAFVAGLAGSLVLLWLRFTDEDLRDVSDYISYLNISLMIALFGTGLLAWIMADPGFDLVRGQLAGLLTFHPQVASSPLVTLQLAVFCAFLIYLPYSRMMHFVGKYFFYHNIMWDDEMMKRKSGMENDVATYLQYKLTWSAAHIRPDGSWVDQVVGGPPQEDEKK